MTQNILTALVVSGTILYAIWRIYRIYISKNRKPLDGCFGCPSASVCKAKELNAAMDKKNEGCEKPERLNRS